MCYGRNLNVQAGACTSAHTSLNQWQYHCTYNHMAAMVLGHVGAAKLGVARGVYSAATPRKMTSPPSKIFKNLRRRPGTFCLFLWVCAKKRQSRLGGSRSFSNFLDGGKSRKSVFFKGTHFFKHFSRKSEIFMKIPAKPGNPPKS